MYIYYVFQIFTEKIIFYYEKMIEMYDKNIRTLKCFILFLITSKSVKCRLSFLFVH